MLYWHGGMSDMLSEPPSQSEWTGMFSLWAVRRLKLVKSTHIDRIHARPRSNS